MVESGGISLLEEDLDLLENDDEEEEEIIKKISVNYFKMSSAIGTLAKFGVRVEPPSINLSSYTFKPNVEENKIYFGLAGLTRIGAQLVESIIINRPYLSLEDFLSRIKTNKIQATMLIKAGAFDKFGEREDMLMQYCTTQVKKKSRMNLQNANQLIELKLVPKEIPEIDLAEKIYRLTKHLKKHFAYGDVIVLEPPFDQYAQEVRFDLINADSDGTLYANLSEWESFYKKSMIPLKNWIASNSAQLIEKVYALEIEELYNKYGSGSKGHHEMEALSFYHSKHELEEEHYKDFISDLDPVDFFSLPEEPVLENPLSEYKVFKLERIVGTCIGRDKQKKIVGFLTPSGFVKLKVYRAQFVKYDKQIKLDGELEKSWFTKGSHLIVQGYRSGDYFIPKSYKRSVYQPIVKIPGPGLLREKRLGEE
jgi:DNA polymerase-3 subunit alpha